ncbi:MAG TPA: branched-chain amino acid ABC transporter ATP-binding protein/permease [Mycobacteriales bacterium]|nr:branched-chain amino acid ABC transporter ATP-binding protein/permease [Mycobacteriales bacterium]
MNHRQVPRSLVFGIALVLAVGLPVALGHTAALRDEGHAGDLCRAGILAIAGLSLNLLAGYAGQISLGQMSLVGLGAFVGGTVITPLKGDLPFGVGLVVAAATGALVALVLGIPALRLRGLYLAVVTIAFAFVTDEFILGLHVFGGSAGVPVPRPYFGHTALLHNADLAAIVLATLVVVLALDVNVTRSKVGRAFQAVRADEDVAAAFGVDPARWKLIAFSLSGAVAGVAGLLSATVTSTAEHQDYDYTASLNLVVIVVVGGLGSRIGVVTSTAFFAILPHALGRFFSADDALQWSFMIGALLLVVTMALNPRGLAGAGRDSYDEWRARRDPAFTSIIQTLPDLPAVREVRPRVPVGRDGTLLRVRDVSVRFGGLQAVDAASFAVRHNTICALVGPNGAGKSTLFSVVSGLRRPDAGTVIFAGRDITGLPPARRAALGIGRTFQLIGLAKDLSVRENLLLAQHTLLNYSTLEAMLHAGRAPAIERRARERAADAIATLRFERYADTPVKRLSHGQQRIVEIACALVTGPELVMLDEPAAGMSPAAREVLAERLRSIRDELGRTVLVIEHDIPLVLDIADTMVVMDAGRVLTGGAPDEVVAYPEVVEAYLGRGYEQALAG